ncbi:MAG TPA: serine hydrolase domain-containing protein [Anaerolineae bacterium]|nr:serine hydrolase domain-containing protein [Anaerolineae bacterium]
MADQETGEESVPNSALYDAIDAYVEGQMRRLNMPGVALAIVEGDKIVHQRGYGRARPYGETPSPRTPFPIGSLTKSFTAMAVMQLVEAGRIELDVPVQRYLPWFRIADPQASAQMTVRHLLNQTSGLPAHSGELVAFDFDSSPGAAERHGRSLAALRLTHPPGLAWEYSNSNYVLLGLIIEAAGGESYAEYVQRHICTPLDMRRTYTSQARAKQNGLAVGHQYRFMIPCAAPSMPLPEPELAGGGLISCAEDLARYMIALLNRGRYGDVQVLSGAGVDELHREVGQVGAFGLSLGQYGMGWFVGKHGKTKLIWHGGTLPDFAAHMALLPEQKKGVVLLFNACHHWMNPVLADLGNTVAVRLAGEPHAPLPFFHLVPWVLRAQLLIPALQVAGVAATLRRLRRWRLDPERRPSGGRAWGLHVLLPLIANLLAALPLKPMLGKRRGYQRLYMSDWAWIAMVCGSFALVWSFLRTGLALAALRKASPSKPPAARLVPKQRG